MHKSPFAFLFVNGQQVIVRYVPGRKRPIVRRVDLSRRGPLWRYVFERNFGRS